MTHWLNTITGRRFDFSNPAVDDIDIVDIAIALSRQARYAGHTAWHYSVAQHSVIVREAAAHCGMPNSAQRWALLHDAAEAYVTDIPWPLKAAGLVDGLADVERGIMRRIVERFSLWPLAEPSPIKDLDLEALDVEADALLKRHADWPSGTPRAPRAEVRRACDHLLKPMHPDAAAALFMTIAVRLDIAAPIDVVRMHDALKREG